LWWRGQDVVFGWVLTVKCVSNRTLEPHKVTDKSQCLKTSGNIQNAFPIKKISDEQK
jgi:hypothetical protein